MKSQSRSQVTNTKEVQLQRLVSEQHATIDLFQERLSELELMLMREDEGWQRIGSEVTEFTKDARDRVMELARTMYLKNPLIKRGVLVQANYVFAQGMSIQAYDEAINEVVQAFLDDEKNKTELTDHQARFQKEIELQTDGNIFFVLFTNYITGRVRLRSISVNEITDIICNPDDRKEPLYYLRTWTDTRINMQSGMLETTQASAYYPDYRYVPRSKPDTIGQYPVMWDSPVYHVKVGSFSNWKFGLSEVYAAIDWARAYNKFLENWATITQALSRYAWNLTTTGGKAGIQAAKTKLNTTFASGGTSNETNPPPLVGSTFIGTEGVKIDPIKTSGANVSADDGRRLMLMVASAVGLPETFFGDVSVGTLATAKSLDRPTELAMKNRQTLWASIFTNILEFVIAWSVKAPRGLLRGQATVVREDDTEMILWPDSTDTTIDIDWPPVVEIDTLERINSINQAAPNIPDLELIARMLLSALGEDDIDEIIERIRPDLEQKAEQSKAAAQAQIDMQNKPQTEQNKQNRQNEQDKQ